MKVPTFVSVAVLVLVALGVQAEDDLSKCIGELEQAYTNFKIPQSIEHYAQSVKLANPQLERLSDAFKLHIKPAANKPAACQALVDDVMEIMIGVPCYFTFANPNHAQFEAYRQAKANNAVLERAFGHSTVCAL